MPGSSASVRTEASTRASWSSVGSGGASPRRSHTPRIPCRMAASTSLSRRSPTIAQRAAGASASAKACSKIAGSGFSAPISPDTAHTSKNPSMPSRAIVRRIQGSWLARTPSRYSAASASSVGRTSAWRDPGGYDHSSVFRSMIAGRASSSTKRSASRRVNGPRWSRRQASYSDQNSSTDASGRASLIAASRAL